MIFNADFGFFTIAKNHFIKTAAEQCTSNHHLCFEQVPVGWLDKNSKKELPLSPQLPKSDGPMYCILKTWVENFTMCSRTKQTRQKKDSLPVVLLEKNIDFHFILETWVLPTDKRLIQFSNNRVPRSYCRSQHGIDGLGSPQTFFRDNLLTIFDWRNEPYSTNH